MGRNLHKCVDERDEFYTKEIEKKRKMTKKVEVVYGIYSKRHDLAGKRVSVVIKEFQEILNLPEGKELEILVNKKKTEGVYTLQPGDTLEFVKPSGENGFL